MDKPTKSATVSSPNLNALLCDDNDMTREEFEAQYLCKFEMSKEDRMIHDHVEAYLIASSGATFAESERLARDLHEWRIHMGIPLKKLNTAKMVVGGRI